MYTDSCVFCDANINIYSVSGSGLSGRVQFEDRIPDEDAESLLNKFGLKQCVN